MDLRKIDFSNTYNFAASLQNICRANKIQQKELCKFVGISEVHFGRKIKDPDSWSIGHIRKLEVYFKTFLKKSCEENRAMVRTNPRK